MRHCHERRAGDLRSRQSDAGFTLIEVMVAFLIIAIIATAGTALTIRGMRATMEAQHVTQAKNLVNAQIEQMRGLPYFVSRATSGPPTGPTAAKVDLLDRYFPNVVAGGAPTCSADAATWLLNKTAWRGYVAAGSAARCSFEPSTGAFYRTIVDPLVAAGSVPTAIVASTQFLELAIGDGTPALPRTPASDYSSDSATGKDTPSSAQISAHVTALWGAAGPVKHSTSRTDIADRRGGPAMVSAETNAAAVVVQGTLAGGEPRRLELGTVAGEGGVTVVTKAAVEAVGGSMQTSSGRVDGAAEVANAPGTVSPSGIPGAQVSDTLSIGATSTQQVAATNSASNPAYGGVASAAAGSFSLDQDRPDDLGLGISTSNPIVNVVNESAVSSGPCLPSHDYNVFGAGFMNTATGGTTSVDACARTGVASVKLFPIAGTAPDGLIQVTASDIVARCEITGSTPTAALEGTLTVTWLTATPSTYSAPTTITLSGTTVTGTLPALTTALGNGKTIGDYITSWGAFSGVDIVQTFDATTNVRTTSAKIPAALSLATVPIRTLPATTTPDPDSQVKVSIGRAIASATDRR